MHDTQLLSQMRPVDVCHADEDWQPRRKDGMSDLLKAFQEPNRRTTPLGGAWSSTLGVNQP
jgi:hypothetical protein